MNTHQSSELESARIEQIEDLGIQSIETAEQVKGGFNPQPDPPGAVGGVEVSIIAVLRR